MQEFSVLLIHFSADLARTVLPDDGREEPKAGELARQADVIAGEGAELAKTAPPGVKADVDTHGARPVRPLPAPQLTS
ncbi:hypothetical protein ACWED2_05275 [Amycolatopsis sp. NPDC005003]